MNRLLLLCLSAFPSFAWAMGDAGLVTGVLEGAVIGLFLLLAGMWALSSLLARKRWILVFVAVGAALVGVLVEGRGHNFDVFTNIFIFIQWLLVALIATRIWAALSPKRSIGP